MRRVLPILTLLLLLVPASAQDRQVHTDRKGARVLPLAMEEGVFHFVIFGDRTGGPREGLKVLAQAVEDTNLLGPDLVMTVGDLVQGYNAKEQWLEQMREYRGIMEGLHTPWFPVAGNHDVYWAGSPPPAGHHEMDYEEHFGPLWYWFKHKNAGFVVLFTDEGDAEKNAKGFGSPNVVKFSDRQLAWVAKTLTETKDLDHVFVFMHHPRWISNYYRGTNWERVHELLVGAGNVTAVFAGHIHRARYDGVRDGITYSTLATTGGGIPMDIPGTGYLHHMNLVTVRKDRITIGAIPVGAVMDPRELTPEHLADIDKARNLPRTPLAAPLAVQADGAVKGVVHYRIENPATRPVVVTLELQDADPAWTIFGGHDHMKLDPGESLEIAFRVSRAGDGFEKRFALPRLSLAVDYLAKDRRITLPPNSRPIAATLAEVPAALLAAGEDRAAVFNGKSALRVPPAAVRLDGGALTVECEFKADTLKGIRAVVGKTEGSGFGLFLMEGEPAFYLHVGEQYVILRISGKPVTAGEWHHMAGVYDGSEMRLYVDGALWGKAEATGEWTRNAMPLFVGAEPSPAAAPNFQFAGRIDEVRISRAARYSGEKFEPAKRHEPDEATALLLHLDRHLGPFTPDHSKAGAHAMATGKLTYE